VFCSIYKIYLHVRNDQNFLAGALLPLLPEPREPPELLLPEELLFDEPLERLGGGL
jgi:hypothetical protein